jgi:hypothetical protein
MSDEQKPPEPTIITPGTAGLGFIGQTLDIWLAAVFAPKWFEDAVRESALVGSDARRREVVFAVCFAESYLLEWVRRDVLTKLDRLNDYFPPDRQRPMTDRWKEVPKRLYEDRQIRGHPDYGKSFWEDFVRLVDYRNGLVHGRASRPDKNDLHKDAKPVPTPGDLEAMLQGWPTRVVVSLVRELHASAGTPPPPWLIEPDLPDTVDPRGPKGK